MEEPNTAPEAPEKTAAPWPLVGDQVQLEDGTTTEVLKRHGPDAVVVSVNGQRGVVATKFLQRPE